MTSIGSASSVAQIARISVPSSMRPSVISVGCAWIGTAAQAALEFAFDSGDGGFELEQILHRFEHAADRRRLRPRTALVRRRRRAVDRSVIFESVGSEDEISIPVGPIEPATKRGRSRRRRIRRRLRARAVRPRRLISPYAIAEAELVELQPRAGERVGFDDVGAGLEIRFVNRADRHRAAKAPALRSIRRSGAPPKSSGDSSSAMSCVPMAPSKIRTRCSSRCR